MTRGDATSRESRLSDVLAHSSDNRSGVWVTAGSGTHSDSEGDCGPAPVRVRSACKEFVVTGREKPSISEELILACLP